MATKEDLIEERHDNRTFFMSFDATKPPYIMSFDATKPPYIMSFDVSQPP